MKIVAGLATFEGRERSLSETVKSLENQVDDIFIYDNSVNIDVKDNGKFYGLTQMKEACYYLTCDDDIIYPKDYVENMVENIEKDNCIITHHGKIIGDSDYLRGSKRYHFSVRNHENRVLDVAGTAVTGFKTSYFNPKDLFYNKNFFVSDLLFGIKVRQQLKKIIHATHKTNWIRQNMNIDFQKSISYIEEKEPTRQNYFKQKLLELKWET